MIIRHRRSIRLPGYDYSQAGAYFITICVQNRACLFGEIIDREMRLNDSGLMVHRWYTELENKFPDIQCHEFVCMPNHVHCIVAHVYGNHVDGNVVVVGADLRVCPDSMSPPIWCNRQSLSGEQTTHEQTTCEQTTEGEHAGSPLHRVVQWFKTMTTNEYIRHVKQDGWPPFKGKLWQRNYWEHIIRNEQELIRIRDYIKNNPKNWNLDTLHLANRSVT